MQQRLHLSSPEGAIQQHQARIIPEHLSEQLILINMQMGLSYALSGQKYLFFSVYAVILYCAYY